MVAQTDLIKTHSVTGGNHTHALYGGDESGSGSGVGDSPQYNYFGSAGIGYSGNLTMTYGSAASNPETRPVNYTIRIWKRVS